MKGKAHSEEFLGEARDYWWNDDYLELMAGRLDLAHCHTLVDVGCGIGYMGFKLAPYLPEGASVFGLDREAVWVARSREKAARLPNPNRVNFAYQVGDAYALPWADGFSDLTLCQTLLIHLQDPSRALLEMKRVTRPGRWIVAIEPNNLCNPLFVDSVADHTLEATLHSIEVEWRIEKGKELLGEGHSSVGDKVPQLFVEAGLSDIQVWIADKALALVPPYDTPEKQARAAEIRQWIARDEAIFDFAGNQRYYLAGGGTEEAFAQYWERWTRYRRRLQRALEQQTYVTPGGGVLYIVAGRKQAA